MRARLASAAEAEVAEAFDWYESQREGLGAEFLVAIDDAIAQVCRQPYRWPKSTRETHRAVLKRFPYLIHYQIRPEIILVVAIAHAGRRPAYWRRRVTKK